MVNDSHFRKKVLTKVGYNKIAVRPTMHNINNLVFCIILNS